MDQRRETIHLPEAEITYVIGDVHGMYEQLLSLMNLIIDDISFREVEKDNVRIIFLGDLIDRGPQSKQTMDLVMSGEYKGIQLFCVMGNHEKMMLDACWIGEPEHYRVWAYAGSYETLNSFGVGHTITIPVKYPAWISKLPTMIQDETRAYVHAGIDPRLPDPLSDEETTARIWIRGPFLKHKEKFPKYIVHGHTPINGVEVLLNRCNLDNGAYWNNPLVAGVFLKGIPEPEKLLEA